MEFQRAFSGAPWEDKAGYCRAIRAGDRIHVSGTAPVGDAGEVVAPEDPKAQAERCWEIVEAALKELGAGLSDVVRTRMYVTDIAAWEAFAEVHGKVFGDHPPATTMVEVAGLIDPEMLIEVEAEAAVAPGGEA